MQEQHWLQKVGTTWDGLTILKCPDCGRTIHKGIYKTTDGTYSHIFEVISAGDFFICHVHSESTITGVDLVLNETTFSERDGDEEDEEEEDRENYLAALQGGPPEFGDPAPASNPVDSVEWIVEDGDLPEPFASYLRELRG